MTAVGLGVSVKLDFVHYEGKLGAYNSRLNKRDRFFSHSRQGGECEKKDFAAGHCNCFGECKVGLFIPRFSI